MKRTILLACASLLMSIAAADAAPRFETDPSLTRNPNPAVPLAGVLRFTASEPVETLVSVTDGKKTWRLTYGMDRDPSRGLPVVGMRPGRSHKVQITIRNRAGEEHTHPAALTLVTPALPDHPDVLPRLEAKVAK